MMVGPMWSVTAFLLLLSRSISDAEETKLPPYIKHQCKSSDPKLEQCFLSSIHHIRPFLATGIPEINVPSTEPFRMDQISLSLTTGPNGYKITLKEVDVFGASNFTASKLKLQNGNKPFEVMITLPKLKITSKYSSSGVLIIVPASGNGTFHSTLGDAKTICRGTVSIKKRSDGLDYIHVDKLSLDLEIKTVQMKVTKVFNNNKILIEAMNLFLRENGQEVLKAMIPQLKTKLADVFKHIGNQILDKVPLQQIYLQQ